MNILYPPVHYYQNQGMVPGTGLVECVTTSVVMVMNMVKDRVARDFNQPFLPDITVQRYTADMDGKKIFGLPFRVPSDFFVAAARGWMHPVWQAPLALRRFAGELEQKYRHACFTVKQTSGNELDGIRQNLGAGNIVLIHGLWEVYPDDSLYKFGGMPHTMLPVDVDDEDNVTLLNPAYPDPGGIVLGNPATYPVPALDKMSRVDFLAFWGRKSLLNLYTRPRTMTVVIPASPSV